MATFSQGTRNENLLIHRGRIGKELKPEFSKLTKAAAKKPLAGERPKNERKALGDLSNVSKPLISTRLRKDLSSASTPRGNSKSTKKSDSLTEEQKMKCQEWAQEGIEHMYFNGNDIQKLEMDSLEKRVKEEVAMATSSLHGWGNDMFDLMSPSKDGVVDSGLKLELEPEILSSKSGKVRNELKPELSKMTKTAKKTLGKAEEGLKTERKALGDLSNVSKPLITRVRKDLPGVPKSSKSTKSAQKSTSLTGEQIKKCQEWAQEGIEHMYFTGNDIQKLERDCMEKRVNEEVEMVISSMHDWGNNMFHLLSPMNDGIGDSELKLEFEPEILPSRSDKRRCDITKLDCLLDESESAHPEIEYKLDLNLKDFPVSN